MPTLPHDDPNNKITVQRIDWMELTQQRAAVLKAIGEVTTDGVFEQLEGVQGLLESLSDLAESAGILSPLDREKWWAAACEAMGLSPCEHEVLTLNAERQVVCLACNKEIGP